MLPSYPWELPSCAIRAVTEQVVALADRLRRSVRRSSLTATDPVRSSHDVEDPPQGVAGTLISFLADVTDDGGDDERHTELVPAEDSSVKTTAAL